MSFQQGLSGLNAASQSLDVIGNNVANANTVGFKDSQAIFADVYANSLASSGSTGAGIGVSVASIQAQVSQGNTRIGTAVPIQLSTAQLQATATANATVGMNLDARESTIGAAFSITNPATYNKATSLTVYDSLGNPHALATYFTKTAANTWA